MADLENTGTAGGGGQNKDTGDGAVANTVPREEPVTPESISVRDFYEDTRELLQLSVVAGANGMERRITEKSLNRPALALAGSFKCFANARLQLFGAGELAYFDELPEEEKSAVTTAIMQRDVPALLLGNDSPPPPVLLRIAGEFGVPVLLSALPAKMLFPEATIRLEELFAPSITLHATLVDIRGVGVLLRGKSGVGKSECALALIERGHSLVVDDLVKIELLGDHRLLGSAKFLSGFMECRGVGIVDIKAIYGVRSVLPHKTVDMVVTLDDWREGVDEERTGLSRRTYEILGRRVPHFELFVRPGRDMARLVEVAAMVLALRQVGYDCALEFNNRLIQLCNGGSETPLPAAH
ncbi:MAG: HPr(Ser) kinase/phosphatase [Puniceicoccales bacterium]|jgi:HPr kinase/phosphorylase|nr:HPr(Ser) kinase/phosphatase [Puniceicoccales bacterium]